MGLKILHSADWHIDAPLTSLEPGDRELLRECLRRLPSLTADLCHLEACDLVLLSGDLLDGPVSRDALDALKQGLEDCGVPVFIAPGNHDYCSPDSPWLTESWPENVHIFTGGMQSVSLPELDCRIWGAGYQEMDCPPLLEGFHAEGEERWQLCVIHGDPTRADSPYSPVTAAQVEASGVQYLALGHVHSPGRYRSGDTLCAWPGCPMGKGWDETGEKGVFLVTLDEETKLQWMPYPGFRFYQETVEIGEDPLEALKQVLPAGDSMDFYRITLTGRGEPDVDELKKAFSGIPRLKLRDKTLPPIELWAGAGEDTLEGVFFRMLRDAAMEAEDRDRQQLLLAAKLSRQLLEGREVKLP